MPSTGKRASNAHENQQQLELDPTGSRTFAGKHAAMNELEPGEAGLQQQLTALNPTDTGLQAKFDLAGDEEGIESRYQKLIEKLTKKDEDLALLRGELNAEKDRGKELAEEYENLVHRFVSRTTQMNSLDDEVQDMAKQVRECVSRLQKERDDALRELELELHTRIQNTQRCHAQVQSMQDAVDMIQAEVNRRNRANEWSS